MKNLIFIFIILCLILLTSLTKNSSKKLETEIYNIRENLSILKEKLDYVTLENNYLASPEKLMKIKNNMKEKYISLKILDLKTLTINNNKISVEDFKIDD